MASSDSVKIGVGLCITVSFIALSILCMRSSIDMVKSRTHDIAMLPADTSNSMANSLNGRVSEGSKVLNLVSAYFKQVPILLVTGEIYDNVSEKYSYDVDKVFDRKAAEYINPAMSYRVDVGFGQDSEVEWIRIVQSSMVGESDLATVDTTLDDYYSENAKYNKRNNLIEQQYQLFNQNKQAE